MTSTLDTLIQADQQLFLALNGYHTPWLDRLMDLITYKFTWIPLYLYLMCLIVRRYQRQSIGILLTLIAAVAVSDQVASGLFKPYFARLRPCHDPQLSPLVHLVGGCGGQFGFVSSHAATAFALAVSFQLLVGSEIKGSLGLFLWAFIYSFSRVYVGVHYPADLLGGALVGVLCGWAISLVYKNVFLRKLI